MLEVTQQHGQRAAVQELAATARVSTTLTRLKHGAWLLVEHNVRAAATVN